MHIDLAHAAVAAVLILVVIVALRASGITHEGRWDWRYFAAIFAVMFVFNLIWPYGA